MFIRSFQKVYDKISGHRSPSSHKSRIEEETVYIYMYHTSRQSFFSYITINSMRNYKKRET